LKLSKKSYKLVVQTSRVFPAEDILLHLTAFDADDLAALSAQMQDAVLKVGDMQFDRRRKVFACVANRFAWDALPAKTRRRCGLRINHVLAARRLHPQPVTAATILSLLSIAFVATENMAGTLTLQFSGGHALAFDVDSLDVQIDDLGPAWGTSLEPAHE
jgi:Protein of unknown function (DUF2948)